MKAYKCILPFAVLFLVHGTSATFGLWNSERIKDLIKHKINRLYIPFITPQYPLFSHDYPIFRYYFLKPASAKKIFINNPVNVQYSTDGVVYGSSGGNMQKTDLSYVNMLGQHGSTYEFHVNNDNVQAEDQFTGGITEEHENEYIYPTIKNDNIQVDDASNEGIVEEYESDYFYPNDSNDNAQVDGRNYDEIVREHEHCNPQTDNESNIEVITDDEGELEDVEENADTSVNPESGIEVVENVGLKVTDSNTDTDYDADVADADKSTTIGEDTISGADTEPIIEDADESILIDKDNISEGDTEPIIEDVDETGFAYAEPASETAEVNGNESDYLNSQSDLVREEHGSIDKYEKLNIPQTDIYSDTGSVKEYDSSSTDTETTTGNGINNPINSNINYFPLIDRIGGNHVEDYKCCEYLSLFVEEYRSL